MRQGYRLDFSIEELENMLESKCNLVNHLWSKSIKYKSYRDKFLKYYLKDGSANVFDVKKLNDGWFPKVECDVFISYSHLDVTEAESIAGLLYKYCGLTSFVDSFFWNSCDELQKLIDDNYSLDIYDSTLYDYRKVQYSASHVHMLLIGQLLRVIENCDCFILWGTPNSLIDGNGEMQSSSPWIYFETLLYDRFIHTRQKRTASLDSLNESTEYTFSYPLPISRLKVLELSDFVLLSNQVEGFGCKDALDIMHEIFFKDFINSISVYND